jgi:hypothetical protein
MTPSIVAAELASTLKEDGKKTLHFFKDISKKDWQVEVYSDGPAWKVHNLLAHFAEVEGSIPRLMRNILKGGDGVREDFDIDRYNARFTEDMSNMGREELMVEFEKRRKSTVDMVQGMSDDDLLAVGRHPFLGESQIKDMVKLMYIHLRIHQRDILKAISEAKS